MPFHAMAIPLVYLCLHTWLWHRLTRSKGAAINPLLGKTAVNLLAFSLLLTAAFVVYR